MLTELDQADLEVQKAIKKRNETEAKIKDRESKALNEKLQKETEQRKKDFISREIKNTKENIARNNIPGTKSPFICPLCFQGNKIRGIATDGMLITDQAIPKIVYMIEDKKTESYRCPICLHSVRTDFVF